MNGQLAGNGQIAQGNQLLSQGQAQLAPAIQGFNTVAANGNQQAGIAQQQFPSIYNQYLNAAGLTGGINPTNPTGPYPGATNNTTNQPNPYALSQPQQTQLNAQSDQYTQQAQAAIDEYRQQAAARGLPPDPNAEANIRATYAAQQQQGKANFEEQARNTELSSAGNLLSLLNSMQGQGTGEIQSGAQGLNSVAGTAGNLSGTAFNEANQLNQAALAPLQGLLQVLGYAGGGGIGGAGGLSQLLGLGGNNSGTGVLSSMQGPAWTPTAPATNSLLPAPLGAPNQFGQFTG